MKQKYTMTSSVRVKNVVGSSKKSPSCPNCGAWIEHWKLLSAESVGLCAIDGCKEEATVGAHVTRPLAENKDYQTHPYIIPLCATHNGKHGEEFDTKASVTFVWANVQETCGK